MKVMILGGCGYIGSRLSLHLREIGHSVNTIDLEWFGNYANPNNTKMDFKFINNIWETGHFAQQQFEESEVVILLAGHSSVPMCKDDMISSFRNNVVNFVDLLTKIGTKKFIYASSSSIYGNTQDIAAPETWERYDPKTFYDLNKQELDYYARLSPVEYYGLRFGTVNGWSPNLRVDIMLNKMYKDALESCKIEVFNKHIFRPILGMEDLCRSIEAIIQGGDHRGIYNLASFNASVGMISEAIRSALNYQVEIVDRGISQTYNFSIDTNKFRNTYDFEFRASVDSIVASFKNTWHNTAKTIREGRKYE